MEKYNHITLCTPPKVGCTSILEAFKKKGLDGHVVHDPRDIKTIDNNLIVIGVRNPSEWGISYFFQTWQDIFHNMLRLPSNKYKGQCCNQFIPLEASPEVVLAKLGNFENLWTLNEWWTEMNKVLNIREFDKEKGFQAYDYKNNKVVVYTYEILSTPKEKEFLNLIELEIIPRLNQTAENKYYAMDEIKRKFKYRESVKNKMFGDIFNLFYTPEQIENFKSMY
jgi:hypothetical protein